MPNMKNNINKNKPNTNHAFMKDDAYKVFDVRIAPAIFIINDQKKIADKNVPVSVLTR